MLADGARPFVASTRRWRWPAGPSARPTSGSRSPAAPRVEHLRIVRASCTRSRARSRPHPPAIVLPDPARDPVPRAPPPAAPRGRARAAGADPAAALRAGPVEHRLLPRAVPARRDRLASDRPRRLAAPGDRLRRALALTFPASLTTMSAMSRARPLLRDLPGVGAAAHGLGRAVALRAGPRRGRRRIRARCRAARRDARLLAHE